jgi:outer membrane receptor protein involved in Fe transport
MRRGKPLGLHKSEPSRPKARADQSNQQIGVWPLQTALKNSGLVVALLISASGTAVAQTAPAAAGDQATNVPFDIVVTARKRDERAGEVPLTVTTIKAETLLQNGQVALKDYITKVPGVSLQQNGPGLSIVTIRGISSSNGNPLVGFTIDDVPLGASTYLGMGTNLNPDLDPADLANIEVLQGPQGTLYGASSMGGLIKYNTVLPSLDTTSGGIQGDISAAAHGNAGAGIRANIATPVVTDRVGIQVSGFYRRDPGFIDDPRNGSNVNDDEKYGGRLAALVAVNDSLTLRASALYQHSQSDATAQVDVDANLVPVAGRYSHSRLPGTDGYKTELQFYTLGLEQDLGNARLVSLTGYSDLKYRGAQDFTARFGFFGPMVYDQDVGINFANIVRAKKFSQEVRLESSDAGSIGYTLGGFYTHEKTLLTQLVGATDPDTGTALPGDVLLEALIPATYEEYAAFASVTVRPVTWFDIEVGGRYSHNQQRFEETDNGLLGGGVVTSGRSSGSPFTFSITPRFHLAPHVIAYGRVASGYRVGGPNASPPPGVATQFKADRTTNYEVGLKADLFDHKGFVALSAFYIDWRDIQANASDPETGFSYTTNQGAARSKGFQGELRYEPLAGLALAGSATYADAYVRENTPSTATIFAQAGDHLPYTPKWAATASADYHWTQGSVRPFVGATLSYTGARLVDFSATPDLPRLRLPAYTAIDLRAGMELDALTISIFCKNVGDERGYVGAFPIAASGPFGATLISPRVVGLSLAGRF